MYIYIVPLTDPETNPQHARARTQKKKSRFVFSVFTGKLRENRHFPRHHLLVINLLALDYLFKLRSATIYHELSGQSDESQYLVISWFMPVNIVITFLLGGILGWLVVKIFRPDHNLEGLLIANSSAGTASFQLKLVE